jgi:predicted P-loop ATPase/GTPase
VSIKTIDKLKGQYCKIVIDEPGKKKASVIYGFLKDVDHKKDFVIIESNDGLGIVNKNTVVAIKPSKKRK